MKKRLWINLLVICLLMGLMPTASAASSWMSECKPYQYTEVTEYLPTNGKSFTIGGQNFYEGYVFYLWNAARTSQVLYNLKGEYSSFTFYVGHVDGTKQYSAQLEIYLDGTISETVSLSPNDIDKKVTVNTDGVSSLKIKMTSNEALNHYDITYGVYNGTFTRNGTTAAAISDSNMVGNCEPYEFSGDGKNKVIRSSEKQEIFMGGDSYTDCLQFYLWNPSQKPQAKFNFGGKYESISFLAGHIDNTSRYPVTFEFTADNKVVKKLDLNPDDLPVPVTLSLSGVKQMIISVTSSQPFNTYDYYYGLGAIQLKGDASSNIDPDPEPKPDPTPTPDPEPTPDPKPDTGVKVTGVKVSKTALTMEPGQSETLTATISPASAKNRAVTWTSNNPAAVSVDAKGRVTAQASGAAEVTVKTSDGGFTAVCRIIVKGDTQPAPAEVHFPRVNVYSQGQFTDVPAGQWYTDSVKQAFELGLMVGESDSTFKPQDNVTVAQAITMAARVHSIYTTGAESFQPSGIWYQVYLDYAFQNGIISYAYYNSDVTQTATRAQFAEIFANALPAEALSPINKVTEGAIPDVPASAFYASHVYKLYRAGILSGSDVNGTFSPDSYITRQEAAAIVSRMAESSSRVKFTL